MNSKITIHSGLLYRWRLTSADVVAASGVGSFPGVEILLKTIIPMYRIMANTVCENPRFIIWYR